MKDESDATAAKDDGQFGLGTFGVKPQERELMSSDSHFEYDYSQVRPAHSYPRTPPNVMNAHSADRDMLRWLFRTCAEPTVKAPSEGYIYVERGFLFDGKHILGEDGAWLPATICDWNPSGQIDAHVRSLIATGRIENLQVCDETTFLVHFAQVNIWNYGHFLCENAPKLMNIAKAGLRVVRILYPEEAAYTVGFVTDILAALGVRAEITPLAPGSLVPFRALLHFTPVAKHNFRKSRALLELRDVALTLYGGKPDGRPVFITRPETGRRRLSNQSQVSAYLEGHGYCAIDPGRLSLAEQVRVFSGAERIVGSVGAGLTNILYAPSGADIAYLCNGIIDLFFWDIAGLCDLRFSWIFAATPRPWTPEDYVQDYTMSLDVLRINLDQLGMV